MRCSTWCSRGRICRNTDRWPVTVNDCMRRCSGKWGRHSLTIPFELVSQHLNLSTHILMALFEIHNKVDSYAANECPYLCP